jgi:hypothetical protein
MFRLVLQSIKHVGFLGMLAFLIMCSVPISAANIVFSSGPNWDVFNADPVTPGAVRLAPAQKSNLCPGRVCWSADLSTIPGATWIWANGVTPSTFPADLKQFFFSKTFVLGEPVSGTISVAVDDFAQVLVNGVNAGTTGSITDYFAAAAAQGALVNFDITSLLKPGSNIVTVLAQNGPAWFAGGCPSEGCTYAMNPAGVVFGGSLSDVSANIPEPESAALGCIGALVLALCGITRTQWLLRDRLGLSRLTETVGRR